MTRKSDSASDRAASSKELKTCRGQIDKLDLHILKLINERADLAARIGRVKTETNDAVFSPAREEEVIANVLAANKGPGQWYADATGLGDLRIAVSCAGTSV